MNQEQSNIIKKGIASAIVILTLGFVIALIVGIVRGNFFPPHIPTKLQITKSPLQVIYTGENDVKLLEVVKEVKEIPFFNYKFNEKTTVNVNTEDVNTHSTHDKVEIHSGIVPKFNAFESVSKDDDLSKTKQERPKL